MADILSEIFHSRPPKSAEYGLPIVRNQQVLGSSPSAGSRYFRKFVSFGMAAALPHS